MAALGVRKLDDLIGRVDLLQRKELTGEAAEYAKRVDLSKILRPYLCRYA